MFYLINAVIVEISKGVHKLFETEACACRSAISRYKTPDAGLAKASIKPATEQEVEEKDSDFCLKNINVITECSYIGLYLKDVTQNLPIYSFLIYSFLVHCDFFKFSAINHLVFASLNYAPLF